MTLASVGSNPAIPASKKGTQTRPFFAGWDGLCANRVAKAASVHIRRSEIGRGAPWCSRFLMSVLFFREEQAPPLRSGEERANHGAKRSYRPCLHTTPKPWTDSNRHIVGDDLLGVPNNSAQTGRRGRRPLRQDAVEQILLLRSVVTVHHHKVREIQKAPTRVPLISVVYFDFTEYLIRQALSRRYPPCSPPTPRRAFSGDGGRVSPVR